MTSTIDTPKKAIILYDSMSVGGSADRLIDAIGRNLAQAGAYVEKARCKTNADYSFVEEFDLVILGAPIYYLLVASKLSGSLSQSNLRAVLKGKKVALFVICGSPEPMAQFLYLPQLKMHLDNPVILAEKAFAPAETSDQNAIAEFTKNILDAYDKAR
ncbi:flavodoxin domain-containing protein [Chlorobaculum sp. MV4-Y]|jgi:flavorubredoxin|uniref:flavodoxin domain-containing protein n=1 Tax=Chlorobaculum sp. MV4-Y TaxID=2976335 RepID=UPI0021AFADB1|nr:flavodoxin domain-containing protein [Chlorobaculum sp. MV4-Y]UWX56809.1 flavodoxin domain-containing protein [Chlorobaculum sp. MV4-Y]